MKVWKELLKALLATRLLVSSTVYRILLAMTILLMLLMNRQHQSLRNKLDN